MELRYGNVSGEIFVRETPVLPACSIPAEMERVISDADWGGGRRSNGKEGIEVITLRVLAAWAGGSILLSPLLGRLLRWASGESVRSFEPVPTHPRKKRPFPVPTPR
jgi:hypothetical protein